MSIVLGLNCWTGENTGTTAAPVWAVIQNIRDETVNTDTALSDVTTRKSNGWRMQVGTLSEATVETQMVWDTDDPQFVKIKDAFLNKSMIAMGFFDGDPAVVGTEGLMGGFGVTNFTMNRELEEAQKVDVTFTAREDDAGNGPSWFENTGP